MTKKDFLIKKGGKAKILRFILFHKVQTKKVYYKYHLKMKLFQKAVDGSIFILNADPNPIFT